MSVNIKQLDGSLKKIAGNTILLDATCSEIRSGTFSIQCQGDSGANVTITFETPMSDTDYVVIFESDSPAAGEIGFRNKTTTGFNLYVLGGRGDTTTYTFTGNYYAFRLVELEGYNAIYNKMTNIDVSPTENSTNLVTSGGVYDAIKNASSVFIGTSSEWESETSKTDYQVAILTDQPTVNAIDSTDGSTTVVGEPNKRWVGSKNEWEEFKTDYPDKAAEYEIVCFTDDGDAPTTTQFATISSEGAVSTIGDYICSKNGKNVCVMLKGHTNGIVTNSTKLYSGFFNPLTPNNYAYLDIPFAIRNRTTNVTEMRMGYLDATGNFYTSAYTEDIASDWDIQLFFSYQTE